jgi:hypothetical protein
MWKAVNGTYSSVTGNTTFNLPYRHDTDRQLCVVTVNSNPDSPDFTDAGLSLKLTPVFNGTNWVVTIENRDLSDASLVVGYTYRFEMLLPKLYFRQGDKQAIVDYSARTTIARMKFSMGVTGEVEFRLTTKGGTDYVIAGGVIRGNEYILNDIPILNETEASVPIHRTNDSFDLTVYSDTPFPVALISMMWEGQYTPRFYRRA